MIVVTVIAVVFTPLRVRLVAAATVADALDIAVPRPFAVDVERSATTVGDIEVDRYGPAGDGEVDLLEDAAADSGVIVLVAGAAPAGRDDTRLVALAEAFARSDRIVVVPELEVFGEDLVPQDIERIVEVVMRLAQVHGPVVLAGISFGGSLSLVAAGDQRIAGDVSLVATFGAYADLVGVLQAATTGVSQVGDEAIAWPADPRASEVVREQLIALLPPPAGEELAGAVDGQVDPDEMSAPARAALELLENDDPARVAELVAELPVEVRERLDAVSPIRAAPDLDLPIVALHARDDPVLPYGELVRMGEAYSQAELLTLATFDHVGIDPDQEAGLWVTVRDLWQTTRFAGRVLDADASWLP